MPAATTTGHALLSLIALRPNWSTYELTVQVHRNLRLLWPRAESRIYDEAKTLVRKGFLHARRQGNGRRPRTVYTISEAGRAELDNWLATPAEPIRLQSSALLRVLFGRLSTTSQLLNAVDQIRKDADSLFALGRLAGEEYLAGTATFQDDVAYRALVFDFLFHHAKMLQDWAHRAETTIADWANHEADAGPAGIERIRGLLDQLPKPTNPTPQPLPPETDALNGRPPQRPRPY